MTPCLPAASVVPSAHVPFASTGAVYLQGIDDAIEVLASLQRPKKVTLRGSDGKRYPMLCKPKDDLRKDARLMEFNGIVNRCLRHDAESRRRDLHIRTFVS
jgi:serine/threonine-protein kinase ATR